MITCKINYKKNDRISHFVIWIWFTAEGSWLSAREETKGEITIDTETKGFTKNWKNTLVECAYDERSTRVVVSSSFGVNDINPGDDCQVNI